MLSGSIWTSGTAPLLAAVSANFTGKGTYHPL